MAEHKHIDFSMLSDSDDEKIDVPVKSPGSPTEMHKSKADAANSWRTSVSAMNAPVVRGNGWQTVGTKSRVRDTGGRGRGRGRGRGGYSGQGDTRSSYKKRSPNYWNYFNGQATLIGTYSLAKRLNVLIEGLAGTSGSRCEYKATQIFSLKKQIEEVFDRFQFREKHRRDPINRGCVCAVLDLIDGFNLDEFPDESDVAEALAKLDETRSELNSAREAGRNTAFIETRLARQELGVPYSGKWWSNLLFNAIMDIYCTEAMKDTRLSPDEMPPWASQTPAETDSEFLARSKIYQETMNTKLEEKQLKIRPYAEEKARNRIITIVGGYGDDLIVQFLQNHKYKTAFANSAQASARSDGSRFENNGLQNLAFGDKRIPLILRTGAGNSDKMNPALLATYDLMRKDCIVAFYNTGTIDRSLLNGFKESVYDLLNHKESKFPVEVQKDTAKFIRKLVLRPLVNRETKPYFQIPESIKTRKGITEWCKGLFSVTDGNCDILENHIKNVIHSLVGLGDPYITKGEFLVHRDNFFPYIFYILQVVNQLAMLKGHVAEGVATGAGGAHPNEEWVKNFILDSLKERLAKPDMLMDPLARVRALTVITGLYSMEKVKFEEIDFFHEEVVRFISMLDAEGSPMKKQVCQGLVTAFLTARSRAEDLWTRYLKDDIHLFKAKKCFDSLCQTGEYVPSKEQLLEALCSGRDAAAARGETGLQFKFYDEKISHIEVTKSDSTRLTPEHQYETSRRGRGGRGKHR